MPDAVPHFLTMPFDPEDTEGEQPHTPAGCSCTLEEAFDWAVLLADDPDLGGRALRHWREKIGNA